MEQMTFKQLMDVMSDLMDRKLVHATKISGLKVIEDRLEIIIKENKQLKIDIKTKK